MGAQHVGLAADLAIFNVTLLPSRGVIHDDRVPFPAARTLIASFHCCLPKNPAEAPAHSRKLRHDFTAPHVTPDPVLGNKSDHHSQGGGGTDRSRAAELKSHRL